MSRHNRSTHAINEQIKHTTKRRASIKHYMFGSFASAPSARSAFSIDTMLRTVVVIVVACIVIGAL